MAQHGKVLSLRAALSVFRQGLSECGGLRAARHHFRVLPPRSSASVHFFAHSSFTAFVFHSGGSGGHDYYYRRRRHNTTAAPQEPL